MTLSAVLRAARRGLALLLLTPALLALAAPAASGQSRAAPETASPARGASGLAAKPAVRAARQMIVAAHPLAAEAGLRALRDGGSAVDAAIAAQLVLNVVEPQSSGVGGGAFALSWDPETRDLAAWDGRETAPAAADPRQFLTPDGEPLPFLDAATSGLAVGVPGVLRMLKAMHEAGGRLPWARLFEDAVALARDGFPVSPRLHASIASMPERLAADPAARALLFDAEGAPLAVGAILRQPALAASLERLAEDPEALYEGPLAEAIVAAARAEPRPGALAAADLAAYRAKKRVPVCAIYRGRFRICGMGPPSSGGPTIALLLGLYERAGQGGDAAARAHRFLEASRLAYADRDRYLADPAFIPQPVAGLLDPAYIAERAALIDPDRAAAEPAEPGIPRGAAPNAPDRQEERPGTTHLSVIDAEGRIVALTSSIEIAFGAGRMAGGFFLNNQLTDFSFRTEKDGRPIVNALAPGKRPRSSMAPTIVFDQAQGGRPALILGSPGGSRIIEYVAGALIGLLDEGLDPAEAAARPHLSHRNHPPGVVEEGAAGDALAKALRRYGPPLGRAAMTSGLHVIRIAPDGTLLGGADPRREGVALGD